MATDESGSHEIALDSQSFSTVISFFDMTHCEDPHWCELPTEQ